ncbi:MAG: hypothetical protein PHX45_03180 [Acidobacteriota bacterium]|nr:hypothetical protein [Acidobacteriota bacterium]
MNLADHIGAVVKRSRAFYRATEPGHFLIHATFPVDAPGIPPLYEFDLDRQLADWLDFKLAAARPGWRAKEGLDDDAIPAICPQFGIAEHSAWLGLDVTLQIDTCLPVPSLKPSDDLSAHPLSRQAKWFQYMKKGYDHLRSRKDGTFFLSRRGTMTPMDMADAWRGNELYEDFILRPDFVHRVMRFLAGAIPWYFDQLRGWADSIDGGQVFYMGGGWMDERVLGHVSNDPSMLCSPEVYEEFGFPYEAGMAKKYSGVFYHVHNEKMHSVPRIAGLPGMTLLEVTNDPKAPDALEDLDRVFASTGKANLLLRGTAGQVRASIDRLKERNVYLLAGCGDAAEARDIVAFVRDRSKPL